MSSKNISVSYPFPMHRIEVQAGAEMAYIDTDPNQLLSSNTLIFLHGNPTYSYMWRNVIPLVSSIARCIAPDLIGFGASSKVSSDRYGFQNYVQYLNTFVSKVLQPRQPVILILHDFGSLFGFHWACHNPDRVVGLVFMEFHPPMPTWGDTGNMGSEVTLALSSGNIRKNILEDNAFIELFIPDQIVRPLSESEMNCYRQPFLNSESRESLWQISQIFPVAGNPPEVYHAVERYHEWLLNSDIPKLFFWADPGKIISVDKAKWYMKHLKNTRSVAVGEAKHFIPEDKAYLVGKEIENWLKYIGLAHS